VSTEELHAIGVALNKAKEHNLETEVVWSALQGMRADKDKTIAEAMAYGLSEWDVL
jgi:hypothetical protein